MLSSPMLVTLGGALAVAVAGGVVVLQQTGQASPSATGSGTVQSSPTGSGTGNSGNGNGNQGNGNAGHPIAVTWTLDQPLVLGRLGTLTARISNQNNQAISVDSVTAQVTGADKAGCNPAWVTTGSYTGTPAKVVAANSSGTVDLPIRLNDRTNNQDACKAAQFSIVVTATARQA